MDEGVVNHSKRDLLEIVVLDRRSLQTKKAVDSFIVYERSVVVAAPSELEYVILVSGCSAYDPVRMNLFVFDVAILRVRVVGHFVTVEILDVPTYELLLLGERHCNREPVSHEIEEDDMCLSMHEIDVHSFKLHFHAQ